jgi:hypothetical protein
VHDHPEDVSKAMPHTLSREARERLKRSFHRGTE